MLIGLMFINPTASVHAQELLIGIDNESPYVSIIDRTTGIEQNFYQLTGATGVSSEYYISGYGLAVHPTTGVVYASVKLCSDCGPGRSLVTIDMTSGTTTLVGELSQPIASLSFAADGVL